MILQQTFLLVAIESKTALIILFRAQNNDKKTQLECEGAFDQTQNKRMIIHTHEYCRP